MSEATIRQIANAILSLNGPFGSRADLLRPQGARRDIDAECDYPPDPRVETYRWLYYREPVANRVVEVLPRESWQMSPEVYEDEDAEVTTPFEEAWEGLGKGLARSYRAGSSSGAVWELLARADVVSGIGQYGVVYLGLDDGLDQKAPAVYRNGQRLLFANTYHEGQVEVTDYAPSGLPLLYKMRALKPDGDTASTEVHASRVVHLADNLTTSTVFGTPRQEPVLNRLLDLRKLYAGSAEMYWQGAFPGLSFESDPSLGEVAVDLPEMKNALEAYFNGLQRFILSKYMTAKSLAPQVVDPTPQILAQIEAICIQLGVPKRVFMGSERGELASSQDADTWKDRLRQRREGYLTPRVICPFVDRLIALGVLPVPPKGYTVYWPDPDTQSEAEKATVALTKTQALALYVEKGLNALIDPVTYLSRVLGMTEDEAKEIASQLSSRSKTNGIAGGGKR